MLQMMKKAILRLTLRLTPNTGTDGSQSCSQSDSSDSESSSSQESSSRSPSPEFSVTTSQTNSLRLTIAQIRKPSPEQEKKIESRKSTSKTASSSSDSEASSDSESDSEKSEVMSGKEPKPAEGKPVAKNLKKTVGRLRARVTEKKEDKNQKVVKKDAGKNGTSNNMAKTRLRQRKTRKINPRNLFSNIAYSVAELYLKCLKSIQYYRF
ncbi:unnamed protein product [Callosobruchus maculatus]|uniref:Uncharacterized protein n=1 Tax=Callosobruchus maculatus TaxID=64391 RepID=A0A653C108_CALMS|nr:unnamed protein product [Callosobruchus maculatus]